MKLLFATGNKGKVEEMWPMFEEQGYELEQPEVDIDEVDALDVEDVAKRKVKDSAKQVNEDVAVMVEDTGFYANGLNGFPGAKASFFDEKCGVDKLLNLLQDVEDRSAYFKTAIAVYIDGEIHIFSGKVEGRIPKEKRGGISSIPAL